MKRITNFIRLLPVALMGGVMLAAAPVGVKALVDLPPQRLIERLVDVPSDFRLMVASDDGQVIAVYTTGPIQLAGLPPFPSFTAQVIVIDRRTGSVELASRTPSGGFQNFSLTPSGNALDFGPLSISRDGRFIAFVSSATNLDPTASTPGYYTFLYDRQTQQVRVLTADELNRPGYRGAPGLIDGSGRKLIFYCRTLAGIPITSQFDVALCERRLDDGATRVILGGLRLDEISADFQVNRDGAGIAFSYRGRILTTGAPNPDGLTQLYFVDVGTGELELVSTSVNGSPGNGFSGGYFSISDDGDVLAFTTSATDLAPGLLPGPKIVVKQRSTGTVRRASSINPLGSIAPHLSGDGRRLVYLDYAFVLTNDIVRIYDWETNSNRAVALPVGGLPNALPCGARTLFDLPPRDYWQRIGISGDGRTLVFASLASNYFPGDNPGTCDLFFQSLGPVPQPPTPVDGPSGLWLWLLIGLLALGGIEAARRLG